MGEGSIYLTLFIRVMAQGRPAGWRLQGRVVNRGADSDQAGLE